MEIVSRDIRLALRALRRSPGFTVAVILTLALGIGANTAIFSLVDAVLLRALPVKDPRQLFFLEAVSRRGTDDGFPAAFFEQVRDGNKSLSGVFAFDTTRLSARVDGQPEVLWGQCVSGNFFELLGVRPSSGRALVADDDRPGSPPAAVISYGYWKRHFAPESVPGRTIVLKGIPFSIVGVAPEAFLGIEPGDAPDLWLPMAHWERLRLNDHVSVGIMGRLRPGVSPASARDELDAIYRASGVGQSESGAASSNGQAPDASRIVLVPGARGLSDLRDEFAAPLAILMAAVMAVLLIACANVANLLLARATARRKEISLRLAIGASRARLIRQLVTESILLALGGGLLGFLLAAWGSDALLRLVDAGPASISIELHHDARVLGFTAVLSLAAGILFGLAPALRATTTDLNSVLKDSSVQGGGGRTARLRGALVMFQVSLSVVLLVAAGLLARTLYELTRVDPGFERDRVLLVRAYPTIVGYEGARELDLYARLQERLQGIPGVLSASLSRFGFLAGRWSRRVFFQGAPPDGATAFCYPISWRFFETMGVPVLQGRDFGPGDGATAPRVAVVSEAFAHAYFPHAAALGQPIRFGDEAGVAEPFEIVGVVRNVKSLSLRDESARPAVYIPIAQTPAHRLGQITIALRTATDARHSGAAIRREVQAIDRDLPIVGAETQSEFAAESLGTEKLMSKLAGAFALLALLLASIGLYGVLAYGVAQRAREIAIRIAIGAKPGDLLRLVLGDGLRLILPGALVGLAAALVVPRALAGLLFGVSPSDPATFAGATLLLVFVGLLACYVPARRAMAGDPLLALRN